MTRKNTTSTEVKQRWENKAYNKYLVRLRKDSDADLIKYIEQRKTKLGTTGAFREALEQVVKK